MWPFTRKIHVHLTARQYGKLNLAADFLKKNPSAAIEELSDWYLEKRYPGAIANTHARNQEKEEKKNIMDFALTGNPMIDKLIYKNQDKIQEWIATTMADTGASQKKQEFAASLGDYLGIMPKI